jgi:hypothetical protein
VWSQCSEFEIYIHEPGNGSGGPVDIYNPLEREEDGKLNGWAATQRHLRLRVNPSFV